ncbi:MAG: hypothetical protein JST67_00115 [Bacteroidetes bacterium]|nr:hypothetical protein [Bacteroidota bacterium]
MIKKCFLIVILSFSISPTWAQNRSLLQKKKIDSLTQKLQADSTHIYRFQKYRPFFNGDQRNSFISSAPINVQGLQLGLMINEAHVVGFGGYMITEKTKQRVKTKAIDDHNNLVEANRTLNLKFGTAFYQYTAIDRRYFELDVQVEAGLGQYEIQLVNSSTGRTFLNKKALFGVIGLGPIVAIKPFKWVGFGGMGGYRFTIEKNSKINFNGFFYGYGMWLDLRQIMRDVNFYWIKKKKYKKQIREIEKQKEA